MNFLPRIPLAGFAAIFSIWISLTAMTGCADRSSSSQPSLTRDVALANSRPPRTRAEFAERFAKIEEYMPEARVVALLGSPDDIRTQHDGDGINLFGAREIWGYGADHHLGFATLGTVVISAKGEVQYFSGTTTGGKELVAALGEREVRRLLRLLADVGPLAGSSFQPRNTIAAVNALQPLGQKIGVAVLREYLDVSFANKWGDEQGMFAVMRALFDVPSTSQVAATEPKALVSQWGDEGWARVVFPDYFREPGLGAPDWEPQVHTQFPRFPLVIIDDVPLVLVSGYNLAGAPEFPLQHLEDLNRRARWRSKPLKPTDDPLGTYAILRERIADLLPPPKENFANDEMIMNQLLSLTDTVVRVPRGPDDDICPPPGQLKALFDAALAATRAKKIRWDAACGRYVFADGGILPLAPAPPVYRREIFEPAIKGGGFKVTAVVKRKNPQRIEVEISVEVEKGQMPSLASSVIQLGDPDKILAHGAGRMEVGATAGDWKYSSKNFRCALPAGQRVQIELLHENERYLSPIFQP